METQVCAARQFPQLSVALQPSEMSPQVFPCATQVVGVHVPMAQMLGLAAPQVLLPLQVPHETVAPHPSGAVPQFQDWAPQVVGTQAPPQTFAVPPPPQV